MMRCADERSKILSRMYEMGGMRREADGGSGEEAMMVVAGEEHLLAARAKV